jgi:hypothetical protein
VQYATRIAAAYCGLAVEQPPQKRSNPLFLKSSTSKQGDFEGFLLYLLCRSAAADQIKISEKHRNVLL